MSKAQSTNNIGIISAKSQVAQVRTRFAPSPTGVLHVGGARTALFNYLFARQNGGKFVLRIEDTDKERSKKEYEDDILNGLKWLGIEWDELYRQSERGEIYKKYIQKLLSEGKAYVSEEKEGKSKSVIRFKNPNLKVKFNDEIRGEIEFDTTELGDFVIAKDEETPLYHLAVVVDDFEMGITHIIRGEDHISNTPRQMLIQDAIGSPRPVYAHIPLILGADRSKLSKRHGAASVNEYRENGYLPEALVNFMAFLGWNPGDEREIFSMDELIKEFSLKKIQKGGAVFNTDRLNWLNSQYIKNMDIDKLTELCLPYVSSRYPAAGSQREKLKKIIELKRERMNTLAEAGEEIGYFFEQPEYEKEKLLWKNEKDLNATKKHLEKISELLKNLDENNFMSQNIKNAVWDYAEEQGRGNVLWPFRVALTGLERSPDPFSVAEILGKEETMARLKRAIEKI
ncbi:MAG: glutamate--tRNA ligase [bacterium]|nr:glutamate--tRNA ligase [bacterium]